MTLFSLFLGVQSAPKVGPTSYETPCIMHIFVTVFTSCYNINLFINYETLYFVNMFFLKKSYRNVFRKHSFT